MASFRILGPVRAVLDERELALGGPRQLTLLAYLLLNANRAVSADALTDAVWGPGRPARDNRLQMAITRLRKALEPLTTPDGPRLRTVSGGYLLAVMPDELDSDRFAQQIHQGRSALDAGQPAQAADHIETALALWRGQPLAEVAFEDFAQGEIRRLEEVHLSAQEIPHSDPPGHRTRDRTGTRAPRPSQRHPEPRPCPGSGAWPRHFGRAAGEDP
jgi:DNA-binding SARP family transcriptional activator